MAKKKGKPKRSGASSLSDLMAKKGDPFGSIGNLSPAQRIKRGRDGKIHEDDPGWNPKTMGNRRGRART